MKKLLIRADDLGYCEGVNLGIAKSVNEGVIRTVGVMPNMPLTKDGLALLKRTGLCLGQHTNICDGPPISEPSRVPSLVDECGCFKPAKVYRAAKEDFVVYEEAVQEIEAQYRRFVALTGQLPDYFEGHAVPSATFFRALEDVAAEHGLKYCGMSFDGTPVRVGASLLHMSMDSIRPDYRPFESLQRIVAAAGEDVVEGMVCHPGFIDTYVLSRSLLTTQRALELEMLCDPATRDWLEAQTDLVCVTYKDM